MNLQETETPRIPQEVLDEQWFSFMHRLIGMMQKRFREAQADRGLTQKTVAERLGKKASFVSRCLSGQQNMTVRTIHDLARGMDCRIDVTFTPLHSLAPSNRRPIALMWSELFSEAVTTQPSAAIIGEARPTAGTTLTSAPIIAGFGHSE